MAEANIMPVGKSKIDDYGIADKVLELRENLSLEDTADVLNAYHLPEGAEPLTRMTIFRWEKKNNIVYKKDTQFAMGVPTSAWVEIGNLKVRSYKHTQRLNKKIDAALRAAEDGGSSSFCDDQGDDGKKKKSAESLSELASISNAYTNALKAHQGVIEQQIKYEKEMLRAEQVKKVLNLMLEVLGEYPEVKSKFMTKLKDREEFELMNAL